MLTFQSEQKIVDINGTLVGGKMGELPTVLIGSIFQKKHYIVSDPIKGDFDYNGAKDLLEQEKEFSAKTGNPRIVDVVADTPEAMVRYLDFILKNTEEPFLVDSPLAKVRMAGVRFLARQGVLERAIYNSVEPQHSQEELDCLAENGVKNVMIMAFGTQYMRPAHRIRLLLGEKNGDRPGLIDRVKETGAKNILIDPGVLDVPSSSWTTKAIWEIKDKIGYPAGCAPSNALYTWLKRKKMAPPQLQACGAAVFALPVYFGANFLLYGPLQNADWVYPAIAAADAMIAYAGKITGTKPLSKEHPLYKIL
jgi:tetrahydromethanopterin S-methyltransferase subunit H